jgi:hypothetical protein
MLALILIVIGILLRFAPHLPDFSPVAAIAIFSGAYLNKKYSFLIPLCLMVISDMFLGFHNVIPFTWGAFALITVLGFRLKNKKNLGAVFFSSLVGAVLFFIITNFGVWYMGWYPRTLKGLADCYILALPFFRTFTVATLTYSVVFFGIYELVTRKVKGTKLAALLAD